MEGLILGDTVGSPDGCSLENIEGCIDGESLGSTERVGWIDG
jgi:hypothetical protein